MNYKDKILFILFLFSVFLLAVIKIENSDAWTHLSIGREIFRLKGLPQTELFTYPMSGKPFAHSSWLFSLLLYVSYYFLNIYGVIILKAAVITALFYILTRDSLQPYKNYIIAICVMTVIVIMVRPRFAERPDIFLMVFLSFSVYSLNAFLYENKKYIYLLPLVHLVWANMHPSITLMFIPFISFIAGGMLQIFLNKRGLRFQGIPESAESREQGTKIIIMAFVFLASLALSLASPYSLGQYTAGAVFAKKQAKDALDTMSAAGVGQQINIIELQRPRWGFIKWPYLISLAAAVAFVLNWIAVYYSRSAGRNKEYPSPIHFFLVVPFIALSFTAMRFVPLLGIIAGPVMARNLSGILKNTEGRNLDPSRILRSRAAAGIIAVWVVLYSTLALSGVAPFGDSRKQFGFGINYDSVPEGALRYMDKRNITGRMFNTFHWGQYITWRDFPKRSAIADGRFSLANDLLEKVSIAQFDPSARDELEKIYGFESVLIEYPLFNPYEAGGGTQAGSFLSGFQWALVYWDDQSLLYLKRGGRYDPVINEDEYKLIKPADDTYDGIVARLHDEDYSSGIIRELKRNAAETGSSKGYAFLGLIYNETGFYKEAIDAFSRVRDFQPASHLRQAYIGIAYAHDKLGNPDGAIGYLKKALAIEEDATLFYYTGMEYIQKGDRKAAIKYFKKALTLNKDFTSIYPLLIGLYRELDMKDEAAKTAAAYKKAETASGGEEYFRKGVNAYMEKNFALAEEEFKKSIEADPFNPAPYSNLGYIYYETEKLEPAYEYHKKALAIDRNFSNSRYGLALIYKKWGDLELAKREWEEYLRLEPAGPYAQKAREDIEAISGKQ
ncbi:MAG: tetratricopeptide repeat protein [Nitrospirae bacterium]|nr:MAG: tetratricopeptide repeat protein [Nitrospirota bacterium]